MPKTEYPVKFLLTGNDNIQQTKALLLHLCVNSDDILLEGQSKNTYENLRTPKNILEHLEHPEHLRTSRNIKEHLKKTFRKSYWIII